jgi:hypothetical protein
MKDTARASWTREPLYLAGFLTSRGYNIARSCRVITSTQEIFGVGRMIQRDQLLVGERDCQG